MHPVLRQGPRLHLRELQPSDTDALFAIYGSELATAHLSFEPRTRDDVRAMVTHAEASARVDPRTEYVLGVAEHATGTLVGVARLAADPHQLRAATMGFALNPAHWGQGLGTETVRLLLALAFEDLALHRVWAARSPANEPSARAMSRAGMTVEGRIREHVHKRGAWRDSVVHAMLEREWEEARGT
ncbi:GNAT family N-acetyltransferase [Streptomyces roseirectus]|uniref:GNAT family N-acetyltransferase n=1 Tax=Streptomyces roseirectus TaxID=2768066 RepID=A0A7H0IHI1_9ACTN|nr:GNAT family protein [Streptomyces roseirectus]QNP72247.1 GNAT family N-acetyltransferase [Streptomyces roseirectus]